MESGNQKGSSKSASGGPRFFKVRTTQYGDAAIIHASGGLDLAASPELEDAIRDAEDSEIGAIVIDLSELAYVDSTGLAVLLEARKRSRKNGGRFSFIPPQQADVTRLLEVTGTVEMLR